MLAVESCLVQLCTFPHRMYLFDALTHNYVYSLKLNVNLYRTDTKMYIYHVCISLRKKRFD